MDEAANETAGVFILINDRLVWFRFSPFRMSLKETHKFRLMFLSSPMFVKRIGHLRILSNTFFMWNNFDHGGGHYGQCPYKFKDFH